MASSIAAGLRPGKSLAEVTELGEESNVGVLNADRETGVAEDDMVVVVVDLLLCVGEMVT